MIGRRRGASTTKDQILEAARHAFAERGFDKTTVREIAAMAGVDPAMINHHFGNKEQLFLAALDAPVDPRLYVEQVLTGSREDIGERLLQTMLTVWDSPVGTAGVTLMRTGLQHEWGAKLLREFLLNRILAPVMRELHLPEPEARWRSTLLASQVAGLIITRYVLKLEPLASAPRQDLVAAIAPTLQRYLTGPIPPPAL
ncbi:TetR/AcrR family transcriptional regulator [Devosia rhizoryzae]|uniref:TetR family transcriptional regulator n=1 Tax=Devosia rhizoryzae TaxID=2774137 RepID=A0ABX7C8U8_9HYPH|nr:TetR family transcriptional regulator [Devosia rhizoryzae]QQR40228.1 TetR family transcriptional regulator [Devosia rhizoryzae]